MSVFLFHLPTEEKDNTQLNCTKQRKQKQKRNMSTLVLLVMDTFWQCHNCFCRWWYSWKMIKFFGQHAFVFCIRLNLFGPVRKEHNSARQSAALFLQRMRLSSPRAISFPEPTCLLVSAKSRSSGIINLKSPRFWDFRFHGACVPWFKTRCLEIKSMWMRSDCLCGTNLHRYYL